MIASVREDLLELFGARHPRSVVCLNVADPNWIPIETFLSTGGRLHLVDWQPGRAGELVASSLPLRDEATRTGPVGATDRLVCSEQLQITIADGALGRAARFATRVEEMIVRASSPAHAIELAHDECTRCAADDAHAVLACFRAELVVSVLSPLDEAYACFVDAWDRRFGHERERWSPELTELRAQLFRSQIEGHALELRQLIDPVAGCVYFVTASCQPAWDRGWFCDVGAQLALATLGQYFVATRRTHRARISAHAALLRPRRE